MALTSCIRIVRPPTPPPTCEERVHYPIFNPHDPRHNPTAIPSQWIHGDYNFSEDSSNTQNTGHWMQSLSEKSLRKARSGLSAIKSGIHRRPSVQQQSPRRNIPGLWMSSGSRGSSLDRPDSSFPSTISEASTDDEFEFGTDLYRTRCNGSSTWNLEIINRYLREIESSHALAPDVHIDADIGPAGSRLEGETLNNFSEESPDSEVTRLPSKTQTITCDDHAQVSPTPSFPSTSDSIIPSRPSTSSNESNISQLIDATQAYEALCSLDHLAPDSPTNAEDGRDADPPLPATSQKSSSSLSEGPANRSNGEKANSEQADNEFCNVSSSPQIASTTSDSSDRPAKNQLQRCQWRRPRRVNLITPVSEKWKRPVTVAHLPIRAHSLEIRLLNKAKGIQAQHLHHGRICRIQPSTTTCSLCRP